MTVKQILKLGAEKLTASLISNPLLETEILLMRAIGQNRSREWLLVNPDRPINNQAVQRLNSFISRRQKNEPIAYITNNKEFYGRDFFVDHRVLIPRPESELLVDKSLEIIKKTYLLPTTYYILELGTGSGCIIISIIKELQKSQTDLMQFKFIATDISADALNVARKNAQSYQVDQHISFIQSDLFSFTSDPTSYLLPTTYSLIIANLPYVPSYWLQNSDWTKTLYFEPNVALDGGLEGMDIYERFFKEVPKYLSKDGTILIECEDDQIDKILRILKDLKYKFAYQVFRDYNNLQRAIRIDNISNSGA